MKSAQRLHVSLPAPTVHSPHGRSAFVTVNEPTLTQRDRPKPMVYVRAIYIIHFTGFDKSVMTSICHHRIIQNDFTAPQLPVFYLLILPPPNPWQHPIFILSVWFCLCRMSCSRNRAMYI